MESSVGLKQIAFTLFLVPRKNVIEATCLWL